MELRLIWFVLAGFILGFATSMLWEWLYFRRQRVRTYVQSATTTGQAASSPYTLIDDGIRSPGVFLESEQPVPLTPLTHRQPTLNASSEPVPAEYELHPAQPDLTGDRTVSTSEEATASPLPLAHTERAQNEQELS
jgi:hypothetical protein